MENTEQLGKISVFVPGYGYDYESDYTFGAYSTYEGAFNKLAHQACFVSTDGSYHISGDYWYIVEYMLDADDVACWPRLTSEDVLNRFKELERD